MRFVRYTCVLTFGVLAAWAQTPAAAVTVQTSGMVGLGDGQTARLNVLNPGVLAPAMGAICTATVAFAGDDGTFLKSTTLSVAPGRSLPFDIRSDTDLSIAAGDRRELRAVILMPPAATASSTTPAPPACKVFPTLEIFDTASGHTLVTLGHFEPVP